MSWRASVGEINYCLKALMSKDWLKIQNFRKSRHKSAYAYVLTRKGIEEKVNVTYAFLRRKVAEYDVLQKEIETLSEEVRELTVESRISG